MRPRAVRQVNQHNAFFGFFSSRNLSRTRSRSQTRSDISKPGRGRQGAPVSDRPALLTGVRYWRPLPPPTWLETAPRT